MQTVLTSGVCVNRAQFALTLSLFTQVLSTRLNVVVVKWSKVKERCE